MPYWIQKKKINSLVSPMFPIPSHLCLMRKQFQHQERIRTSSGQILFGTTCTIKPMAFLEGFSDTFQATHSLPLAQRLAHRIAHHLCQLIGQSQFALAFFVGTNGFTADQCRFMRIRKRRENTAKDWGNFLPIKRILGLHIRREMEMAIYLNGMSRVIWKGLISKRL